jgi:DNA-binding response OmpR family regulator
MKRSPRDRQGRVLVVDANDVASRALALIVEYDGHEVRQAADETSTHTLIREFKPHVVLLDPTVSTVVPRICDAMDDGEQQPAIILTSPPTNRLDRRALRWIVGRVRRPFDFIELRSLVGREIARLAAPRPLRVLPASPVKL